VLLDPVEPRQVALQEGAQALATAGHVGRGNLGIGQQHLSGWVFEQGHPCHPQKVGFRTRARSVSIPPHEKRLHSN
jgi:hypothetical protein